MIISTVTTCLEKDACRHTAAAHCGRHRAKKKELLSTTTHPPKKKKKKTERGSQSSCYPKKKGGGDGGRVANSKKKRQKSEKAFSGDLKKQFRIANKKEPKKGHCMNIQTNTLVTIERTDDPEKTIQIALPDDEESILLKIEEFLDEDAAGECDYDLFMEGKPPRGYTIKSIDCDYDVDFSNYETIQEISSVVYEMEEIDYYDEDKFVALLESGESLNDAIEYAKDDSVQFYRRTTAAQRAEEMVDEDFFSIQTLKHFIDFEAVAEDMIGEYKEVNGGLLIFD